MQTYIHSRLDKLNIPYVFTNNGTRIVVNYNSKHHMLHIRDALYFIKELERLRKENEYFSSEIENMSISGDQNFIHRITYIEDELTNYEDKHGV